MTAGLDAYSNRASNYAKPADWVDEPDLDQHDEKLGLWLSNNAANYYCDSSEFQTYYNSTYPYPMAAFRFHNGNRTDYKAVGNWGYHKTAIAKGRTRVVLAYSVFRRGGLNSAMASIREVFGTRCPTNRLVIMLDMESGSDFAGPGNHSAEANQWAATFADYVGTDLRVMPYANAPDYAACWPQMSSWLLRHKCTAKYSSSPPAGSFAWQYYGALPYSSPTGAPRSANPFGGYVDLNVIYQTIDEIEVSFGIGATPPTPQPPKPPTPEELSMKDVIVKVGSGPSAGQYWAREAGSGQYWSVETGVPGDNGMLIAAGFLDTTAANLISADLHAEWIASSPNKGFGQLNG